MPSNIIRIFGGLGNQMFQYAMGLALPSSVAYDLRWFEGAYDCVPDRSYGLAEFACNIPLIDSALSVVRHGVRIGRWPFHRRYKYLYEDETLPFDERLFSARHKYLIGYFQHAEYISSVRERLMKDFQLRLAPGAEYNEWLRRIRSSNAVSIHVRRGDYLNHPDFFSICGLDYYRAAVELIASRVDNPSFFVFSDDKRWTHENLKLSYPCEYVETDWAGRASCDLMLMRACQHNIIANSSYSWWSAYLNDNAQKIVVAQKKWFCNGKPSYILPKEWCRL